ncbi:hypothetical protein DV515_00013470 [Chloebia gouldiae]|uniref:Phosphatidylethanolamine N-methyltransferase n=1 Tax=Chloebia gouldiae TaxID=44316 RepID=A0A3L8S1V3_CHLGU|nr:hypothetical protein DV515_00013470 [Chloebia gouldiae]
MKAELVKLEAVLWVARWEHKTQALSQIFGSPRAACYCLGAVILVLNCVRSHCFTEAMKSQPKLEGWDCHWTYYSGLTISAVGTLFVISSFLALGFTGTFLGDYFGILMEEKVTSFPFSILDNPMYWGSTAIYLGWSLMHASPAGLLLTAVVAISYTIAVLYEGPFTEEIYRRKQKGEKSKALSGVPRASLVPTLSDLPIFLRCILLINPATLNEPTAALEVTRGTA